MEPKIRITENGPYLVSGPVPLSVESIGTDDKGGSESYVAGRTFETHAKYALCRCGQSQSKPFCDSSHARLGFDGTETAERMPYAEQATVTHGPSLELSDAETLCSFARFCDQHGTIWALVEQPGNEAREFAEREARHCPSGRLVVRDVETGVAIEPSLPQSIVVLEDPAKNSSGPLWVRGGIEIVAADGTSYEIRNRVTLCRCGASNNKPFCDGSHVDVEFHDGL